MKGNHMIHDDWGEYTLANLYSKYFPPSRPSPTNKHNTRRRKGPAYLCYLQLPTLHLLYCSVNLIEGFFLKNYRNRRWCNKKGTQHEKKKLGSPTTTHKHQGTTKDHLLVFRIIHRKSIKVQPRLPPKEYHKHKAHPHPHTIVP